MPLHPSCDRKNSIRSAEFWLVQAGFCLKDNRRETDPVYVATMLVARLQFCVARIIESYAQA